MKTKIPRFKSEAEEAAFWDTHDVTDLLDELEEDTSTVFVRPENGVIELGSAVWRRVVKEAKRRRTTPQRLVQRWLKERLESAS